jgi:hypothetical protein
MISSAFLPLAFVNRTPEPRTAAAGGRSSSKFFVVCGLESTAYKAPGAAIEGVPATLIPPEKPLPHRCTLMMIAQAATAIVSPSVLKYTSSGVR